MVEMRAIRAQGRERHCDSCTMFFKDKGKIADGDESETMRIWFKVVYVFERLSRDLWPSLRALDRSRPCHIGKVSR